MIIIYFLMYNNANNDCMEMFIMEEKQTRCGSPVKMVFMKRIKREKWIKRIKSILLKQSSW